MIAALFITAALSGCASDPAPDHVTSDVDGDVGADTAQPDLDVPPPGADWPGLRRMSRSEYQAALSVILKKDDVNVSLVPDDPTVDGMDNDASLLGASVVHVDAWRRIAEQEAEALLSEAGYRINAFGCDPLDMEIREPCLEMIAADFGRRVYRRPLTDEEIGGLLDLAELVDASVDPAAGPQLMVEALLQSPSFLYRTEMGAPGADVRTLTAYELASKMAFLFWAEPPDDDLLDQVAAGALVDEIGIEIVARRMLKKSGPSYRGMTAFFRRWHQLDGLAALPRDPERFPTWSWQLTRSMEDETLRFLYEHAAEPVPFLDALTSRYTWVDPYLAPIYGMEPPWDWTRVALADDGVRGGVLSQPALLALYAPTDDLAPIMRGKYITDAWLCDSAPPPPDDVPPLPEATGGESLRERLQAHVSNPDCVACHTRLDGVGFGMERYGLLGEWRARDHDGFDLTGAGALVSPIEATFNGPVELGALLREQPDVARCVIAHYTRWASGRPVSGELDVLIDDVHIDQGLDFLFTEMMVALVVHPTFRQTPSMEGECE
ncbi:MAG: DUF1592 domain-containing protein [Myxococcota bacterium]